MAVAIPDMRLQHRTHVRQGCPDMPHQPAQAGVQIFPLLWMDCELCRHARISMKETNGRILSTLPRLEEITLQGYRVNIAGFQGLASG